MILEATIRVLRRRGLSGLKVEDVAKEAAVGKGTVYLYFHDKQDLLKALVEHHTLSFYRDAEAIIHTHQPFVVRLKVLLERRLAFIDEWQGQWEAVAHEARADTGEKQAWLKSLHERYQKTLEGFVESGVATGTLRRDLVVPLTAAVLAGLFCSPQLNFPREAYVEHLVSVFMKGVSA